MGVIETRTHPLHVAIVGSGPAGFFTVEQLLSEPDLEVHVDLFERLPVPYGLVRFGVAPDHQKIKTVARRFEKLAADPRFRLFCNVRFGTDVDLEEMRRHYHAICFATGTPASRTLGIPGEHLNGCQTATDFVAWYNGHPDHRDRRFDLSRPRVAIVGIGNVALDVARMFCLTSEELARTDIADHALNTFRRSRVREVVLLGRRGPAQAAFTPKEIKELAGLKDVDLVVRPGDLDLDDASREMLRTTGSRKIDRKLETLRAAATRPLEGRSRTLTLRFCVSPVELLDDGSGRIGGLTLVRNRLEQIDDRIHAVSTGELELLDTDMVFAAIGYRGVPLPGIPFDEMSGTVPNAAGRVLDARGGHLVPGLYVAGWVKRGPSGVIGTNRPDAAETVGHLLEDTAAGRLRTPDCGDRDVLPRNLAERGVRVIDHGDWKRIDRFEMSRGAQSHRPRIKLTSIEECLALLEEKSADSTCKASALPQ